MSACHRLKNNLHFYFFNDNNYSCLGTAFPMEPNMKKRIVFLFLFVLIVSSAALKSAIFDKPGVGLKNFDIDSISLRDVTFLFEIKLKNPYPVGLRLEDVGFVFKIDGNQVFKTRTPKGLTVKARGSTVTPVLVNLVYEDIMRLVKNYSSRDYLDCRIDVDIVIPLPKAVRSIKRDITFDYTVRKKIPALKPGFSVVDFTVTAPSVDEIKRSLARAGRRNLDPEKVLSMVKGVISGRKTSSAVDLAGLDIPITVSFDAEVRNDTRAQIKFQDLAYDFTINGVKVFGGTSRAIVNEGARSIIRVTNTFSSKMLGSSVVKMFDRRKGSYRLEGHSNIRFPEKIKSGPLKLAFRESGTFKLK